MSFLKKLFGGSQKNKVDKKFEKCILKNCIASNSLYKIQYNDLAQIRLYLEGKNGLQQQVAFKQFFQILESGNFTIPARLKIMTTVHKYIIEFGENFSLQFVTFKFQNLQDNNTSKKSKQILIQVGDADKWIDENIGTFYMNYLQRLSNNYQIYKICIEEGQLPQNEDIKTDYKLKFMWLFKLSNLFTSTVKLHKNFARVFKDYPSYQLIQDIALLVLHDCVCFYNTMSIELEELVQTYPLLTTLDSMQFYQIYTELNILTEQMKSFYLMKKQFDEYDYIVEPKWFNTTPKLHKEIEKYSMKVELLHTSASIMRKSLKNNENSTTQFNFTETGQYEKNRSKSAQLSKEVSENLNQQKLVHSKSQFHKKRKDDSDTEEDSDEESPVEMKQNHNDINKMQTENIFVSDHQKNEEYFEQLQDEDIDAIKQYEQLLIKQKQMNQENEQQDINGEDMQQDNDQENSNKDEEEGQINEVDINNLKSQLISLMPKLANVKTNSDGQQISPQKPIKFRCDEPQEITEKESEVNVKKQRLYSEEVKNGEINQIENNINLNKLQQIREQMNNLQKQEDDQDMDLTVPSEAEEEAEQDSFEQNQENIKESVQKKVQLKAMNTYSKEQKKSKQEQFSKQPIEDINNQQKECLNVSFN